MLQNIWKILSGVFSRVLLTFAWLIMLSICIEELETMTAIFVGIGLILLFYVIHVKWRWPQHWDHERIQLVFPKRFYFLLLTAFILVLGDVFWIFHIKTSQMGFDEDPLSFMVLGIIAFPWIEEFGFRLWLQGFLESKFNKMFSIILAALIFSLFHKAEIPIPQLLSGILYGVVLVTTKSIWMPIILHAFHNAILILSGKISVVKELSFQLMDRTDHLNLIVAVVLWIAAAICIYQWISWHKFSLSLTLKNNSSE